MKPNDVRKLLEQIQTNDNELSNELDELKKKSKYKEKARSIAPLISPKDTENLDVMTGGDALETIVLSVGRPVLTIQQNEAILKFEEPESEVWRSKLTKSREHLVNAVQSVGRIELKNHASYEWVGTGWVVAENIIVTNRHVAEVFGRSNGNSFVFRQGFNSKQVKASIDFLEEANRPEDFTFELSRILHIEPEPGPDVAFFMIKPTGRSIPEPIQLAKLLPNSTFDVAVIGYPARDSRIPDQQLMERIFGNVYDKKRLAPGQVTAVNSTTVFHDCSTLGGCSGGAVIDLVTGEAVGLHFAGRFMETNYAVPAPLVAQRLKEYGKESKIIANTTPVSTNGSKQHTVTDKPRQQTVNAKVDSAGYSITIPLNITVSFGEVIKNYQVQPTSNGVNGSNLPVASVTSTDREEDEIITEGTPEDYVDRKGYDPGFLGDGLNVPLPEVTSERRRKDLLTYDNNGREDTVLRYEHFSVAMSKARRICFYSAVNINGRTSRGGIPRVSWRLDPRIDADAQIIKECYGNPPKFSRGHMTRREDPVWGGEDARIRGNADSMCVTNTAPQMQSFNAPVWVALEDHALDNAREDKMRISVFTGPIMKSGDPVRYGVKIPVEFWKIIAFVHDETGELCATGYKMSQKDHLPEEEFVFGEFDTAQVPIRRIENLTGLSFGNLSDHDPLNDVEESMEGPDLPVKPLRSVSEVRFF